MPRVHKSIEEARKHLGEAAPVIGTRYKEATAKAVWAEAAASNAAKANYEAGLAEAIAAGRREANIREAGDTKYRKGCSEKGAAVIGGRITAALAEYASKFSPVLSAMNSAADAAPARTRDFRTNITNRLMPVVEAAKRAVGKPV